MMSFFTKYKIQCVLAISILAFVSYFSFFTILRYKTLYASYFDLGIMHQAVFNTYKALEKGDWGRFLELTKPYSTTQIKRMAIHNDILLAILAPFYFMFDGPETLLVIQSVVVGLGAWIVYAIAVHVFEKKRYAAPIALIFALGYLLNPIIGRATIYEFHAVTLSTTFLLCTYFFWVKKKYIPTIVFFILSIISKEQVALTTAFFGLYILWHEYRNSKRRFYRFGVFVFIVSVAWFIVSMVVIIPYFRGENHFAITYYGDFGDSPSSVVIGLIKNPLGIAAKVFNGESLVYIGKLLGSVGFLSLFLPTILAIAVPEFAINVLSNNYHMREAIFHYEAVIQPWLYISSIYGAYQLITILQKRYKVKKAPIYVAAYFLVISLFFAYWFGPLPYARKQDNYPTKYPQQEYREIQKWSTLLHDRRFKVSTTEHFAPFFTSRRYFYNFSDTYQNADYILVQAGEIYNSVEKERLIPPYERLKVDKKYQKIYQKNDFEVYEKKKIL